MLAAEPGTIEFDTDRLGGKIARLHRADGTYWYYAHLSAWNNEALRNGQHVETGDVIGFCGSSGDAREGPTHVHFGWYGTDGVARDPMPHLLGWLRQAEARSKRLIAHVGSRKGPLLEAAPNLGATMPEVRDADDTASAVPPAIPRMKNDLQLLWVVFLYMLAICAFSFAVSGRDSRSIGRLRVVLEGLVRR